MVNASESPSGQVSEATSGVHTIVRRQNILQNDDGYRNLYLRERDGDEVDTEGGYLMSEFNKVYCRSCKKEIDAKNTYCPHCGVAQHTAVEEKADVLYKTDRAPAKTLNDQKMMKYSSGMMIFGISLFTVAEITTLVFLFTARVDVAKLFQEYSNQILSRIQNPEDLAQARQVMDSIGLAWTRTFQTFGLNIKMSNIMMAIFTQAVALTGVAIAGIGHIAKVLIPVRQVR